MVFIHDCKRVHWGEFERPMILLFEVHDKVAPPSSCEGGPFPWIIHSVWSSDPEFATFLASSYGLNTRFASFRVERSEVGDTLTTKWTWQAEGSAASEMQVLTAMSMPNNLPHTIDLRYAWDNGQGISIIEYNETATVPSSAEQYGTGTFAAPMMHETAGVATIAGTADEIIEANVSGSIRIFGDYKCSSSA